MPKAILKKKRHKFAERMSTTEPPRGRGRGRGRGRTLKVTESTNPGD